MEAEIQIAKGGSQAAPDRPSLVGLDREGFAAVVETLGKKPFRAKQLWSWIYRRGARSFDEMTNLSKELRTALAENYTLDRPAVTVNQRSTDGTRKWLLGLADGSQVEAVHIPEARRGTLCVSSQVGCTLSCRFCHTGTQRLVRNLDAAEVVGQVMLARDDLGVWTAPDEERDLTNIVMMGMGEPLYNYDNVAKALRIVMDPEGIAISKRRITLSTAGVVPLIERCGAELGVNLAVSLHAVTDELRDEIVPINRKYPLDELLHACRTYPGLGTTRRITFEYVMLRDVNDSPAEARELVRLVSGIPAKINLIPFNPWPGSPYDCSTPETIRIFAGIVERAGYVSTVRTPRGRDIFAACGQLKTATEKQRASERRAAAQ
jgi:23S rRNA (adenine2503-C2)-methyltransferase